MAATLHLKPADDRAVPMPECDFRLMPREGCEVPNNDWYRRRLADGDAVEIKSAPAVVVEPPTRPAKSK